MRKKHAILLCILVVISIVSGDDSRDNAENEFTNIASSKRLYEKFSGNKPSLNNLIQSISKCDIINGESFREISLALEIFRLSDYKKSDFEYLFQIDTLLKKCYQRNTRFPSIKFECAQLLTRYSVSEGMFLLKDIIDDTTNSVDIRMLSLSRLIQNGSSYKLSLINDGILSKKPINKRVALSVISKIYDIGNDSLVESMEKGLRLHKSKIDSTTQLQIAVLKKNRKK